MANIAAGCCAARVAVPSDIVTGVQMIKGRTVNILKHLVQAYLCFSDERQAWAKDKCRPCARSKVARSPESKGHVLGKAGEKWQCRLCLASRHSPNFEHWPTWCSGSIGVIAQQGAAQLVEPDVGSSVQRMAPFDDPDASLDEEDDLNDGSFPAAPLLKGPDDGVPQAGLLGTALVGNPSGADEEREVAHSVGHRSTALHPKVMQPPDEDCELVVENDLPGPRSIWQHADAVWEVGAAAVVPLVGEKVVLAGVSVHVSHHVTICRSNGASLVCCTRCMGLTCGAHPRLLAKPCRGSLRTREQWLGKERLSVGLWPTLALQRKFDPTGVDRSRVYAALSCTVLSATTVKVVAYRWA